jgi:hypothetical protein
VLCIAYNAITNKMDTVLMMQIRQTGHVLSLRLSVGLMLGLGVIGYLGLSDIAISQTVAANDALATAEQSLFSRDFSSEPTKARLDRLETSVFGENQTGPESERQARLLQALDAARLIMAQKPSQSPPDEAKREEVKIENPAQVNRPTTGDSDYPAVTALEREVFSRDFLREDVTHRLDRLEKRALGQSSPQMPLSDRVDRLMSMYPHAVGEVAQYAQNPSMRQPDALKWQSPHTAGYSGSFFSPTRMPGPAAGAQSYTSNPDMNPTYPPAGGRPPQNVRIGGGFSSSTNSAYHFSPEMMSMLPPDLQRQMSAGNIQSSGISGAGTVVSSETTTYSGASPGFQPYGGQPMQTYNYYGSPSQVQSNSTALVPQSGIMTSSSTTTTSMMPSQNPNGLPTPVYVGDPALLQNLGNLELNVYGQMDLINPVPARLGRLESSLLGQSYANYPDDQRLANLQRAYQAQTVGRLLGNSKAANLGRAAGNLLLGVPLNTPTTK